MRSNAMLAMTATTTSAQKSATLQAKKKSFTAKNTSRKQREPKIDNLMEPTNLETEQTTITNINTQAVLPESPLKLSQRTNSHSQSVQ